MSCDSLSQQSVRMSVSSGALPEGFCPASMQDLFNAFTARLIVTANQDFSSFAVGSVPPSSNVGPWLRNCEQWFVWSDSLGQYVPIEKGGFNNEQYFASSGNFMVPNFIYKIKVSAWGAGGGGGDESGGGAGGGGGGGGYAQSIFAVTPGQVIPIVVGTGGSHGAPGADGTNTTVLTLIAGGGKGSPVAGSGNGGLGGTSNGGDINLNGQAGHHIIVGNGGPGGDSPKGGGGGVTDPLNRPTAINGQTPGGGGAGATTGTTPGNGAPGSVLIEW